MMKKNKLLAAVLSVALACTCMPTQEIGMTNVFAEEEIASDFDIDENGVLKKYNGVGGDVVIPEGVTSIGYSAFNGCSSLTGITIPESVTEIGYSTFDGCSGLTSITVVSGNSKYDSREDCNAIIETKNNKLIRGCNNTVILEGVTSIEEYAFSGCSNLTSIKIPKGVTSIRDGVFSGCSSLASISVDSENSKYDSREDCNAIIETENNKLIAGCHKTIIPEGVTSIGDLAFSGCSSLKSVIIPDSVNEICRYAFSGCSSLTSITIPDGVTHIYEYAFLDCTGLTSISIPKSVTQISFSTVSSSPKRGIEIVIPRSFNDKSPFSGCSSLASITVDSENNIYDSRGDCNAIISTKTNELILGCKNTVIPEGVTSIGESAFGGCSDLTSITIPESVTTIGNGAFNGCSGLTSITIPEGVTNVGYCAFNGCSGLTSITIPEGVTNIGHSVFNGCSGLTSITIPEGVTSVGNGAFYGCSGLTSITIPNSVAEIGDGAFGSCSSLTSITVDSENNIYDSRGDCNAIIETETNKLIQGCQNTIIPKGVTGIGYCAFYGCSGLADITIPESVTKIEDGAFYNCSSLTSMTIPKGVTEIGYCAFYGCSGLAGITISESVTNIDQYAFYNCDNFTTIKGKKVSYAEEYANEYGYKFVDIDDDNTGEDNPGGNNTVLMGDLNGDKKINLNDAKLLLKAAVGIITLTDEQKKVSDINNDMKINLNDAKLLLRIAVGIAN